MLLHCGRHPFHSEKGLNMECLLNGQFSKNGIESNSFFGFRTVKKERFSDAALKLCRQMVNPSAPSRITASTALQSPWFSKAGPQTPKIQPQNQQGPPPAELLPPVPPVVREGYSEVRTTRSNSDWMELSLPKGEKDAPTLQVKEDLFGARWRFPQRTRSAETDKATDRVGDFGAWVFPNRAKTTSNSTKSSPSLKPSKAPMAAELCAMGFAPAAIAEAVGVCHSVKGAATHILSAGGAQVVLNPSEFCASKNSPADALLAELVEMGFDPLLSSEAAKRFTVRSEAVDWVRALS